MKLQDTLDAHQAWLSGDAEGELANLRDTDLPYADLAKTNLAYANLARADLHCADLYDTDLSGADLYRANLREASLRNADLHHAILKGANLSRANLKDACLVGTDLSGAEGLTDPTEYLQHNFETDEGGVLCYKTFGRHFDAPDYWKIEEGSMIEENANPLRTVYSACGVNVVTRQWMRDCNTTSHDIWRCRIEWPDLASVVVPYKTNGKIRAGRVKLLEKVDL